MIDLIVIVKKQYERLSENVLFKKVLEKMDDGRHEIIAKVISLSLVSLSLK
jgi:hypothetical protein